MKKLMIVALLALFAVPAYTQTINVTTSAGAGSYFAEEDQTFDSDALFAAFQLNMLELPIFNGASGVGVEVGFSGDSESVRYSLWSLNRADVLDDRMYGGADMKFAQSDGGGFNANFDTRVVVGAYLGSFDSGDLVLEVYSLEEDRPVSFAFLYRW